MRAGSPSDVDTAGAAGRSRQRPRRFLGDLDQLVGDYGLVQVTVGVEGVPLAVKP
jgi:hypothetical protein